MIDGQQRLTTLTILCAAIRDVAENEQEKAALSQAVYVTPMPIINQLESVRVKPHAKDEIFFRQAIQLPGATASDKPPTPPANEAQTLMWSNAQTFRSRVQEMSQTERQRLVTYLLTRCVVIVVITPTRAAGLRIFRVLNDRGLDLSNSDVIKADLLEKFSNPQELTHYADWWRQLEDDAGRQEFESILEYLRFIREKSKNRRTLSEAYEGFLRNFNTEAATRFFQNQLAPATAWFGELMDGDGATFAQEIRPKAVEALAGLRLLPNRDWLPTALAVVMGLRSDADKVEALVRLEALAWVMQLGRRYDTQRMNRYAEALTSLAQSQSELIKSLTPTTEERFDAREALNGSLYETFPVRVVRAVLERLDRLLSEQPVVWNGPITVEHILPQHPSEGQWSEFPESERGEALHRLGNLVLLTKRMNRDASNLPFDEKRTVYFGLGGNNARQRRATYASVQELAHVDVWTPAEFRARHERHLKLLSNCWGIE